MSIRENLIKNIKDEVNELHPLLEKLLIRLPAITDLEYTHGPNEMGADIVLEKKHESLGHSQYIGIVAKTGKVHQNFSDIERQIDECFSVPRFFRNGKEDIFISEVWVIVTQNITNGAQKKIRSKFISHSIEFIDGKRLKELINKYLPIYWEDLSLQISDYLSTLRKSTLDTDRRLSLIEISDEQFYIEQEIHEFKGEEYKFKRFKRSTKRRNLNIHHEIEKEKILLVEGSMGAGKSKLLRQLVLHYTQPEIYKTTNFLPIHCSYKDFLESNNGDFQDLMQSRIPNELFSELEDEKYLIFIDGFDEKKMSPDEQIKALSSLIQQVLKTSNIFVVITARYLPSMSEENSLDKKIARYELSPLSLKKTISFIQALCTNLDIKTRIIEDLKKSPLFKELPRSPIAAILLAKLLNENSEELPSNMTELYSKYTELMLGRWDMKKGIQSEKEYQALNNISMQLANHFISNEIECMPVSEAKGMVDDYLKNRNLGLDSQEVFDRLINRTEIVVSDHFSQRLSFKHRTFAEFFFAKEMLKNHHFEIDNKVFQSYWNNSYFFYLGLRKDCPELLETISNLKPTTEAERWLKLINMGNFLLAAYSSPYDSIVQSIKKSMLDAGQLYLDTVKVKEDTPFTYLPQMSILWLIQLVIRNGYSFSFFKKALESAALSISCDEFDYKNYDAEIKPYALFFLNVTYIELGLENSFDFLLESFKDTLPLDISLALRHESEDITERTRLMKKQDKRVRKLIRGNQNLKQIIERMYSIPVKQIEEK